ncbi:hypothetical protein MNBD_GAMMA10-1642 [hydrothermal vent metagenome]|uniref:Uncharacterized protein n=1 Tax=hydrothermal vent metagenome TaxID=652676 RepID=A0A3B0XRR3_9ZZZZ
MGRPKNNDKIYYIIFLISSPAVVWVVFKSVRVLMPELVSGITCKSDVICLDDVSRYPEAVKLYNDAVEFVELTVGRLEEKPKIIFCSLQSCFKSFGFNKASAYAVGKSGIVIGPKS